MKSGNGMAGTGTSPLAMLAHAYLAVVRRQALEQGGPGEKGAVPAWTKS